MSIEKKKPQSIFALMGTDVTAEEDGRWFNDIFGTADKEADLPGVDVKLRRFTSKIPIKIRNRLEKDARIGVNRSATLPEEVMTKIVTEQLARGVILGWRGMFGEDGTEIEFSPETAIDLLTKLPNLRLAIITMSLDMDNFRSELREQVEGN